MFFNCAMASKLCRIFSSMIGLDDNLDLLAVSRSWICEKSDIVHATRLWFVWNLRNDICLDLLGLVCRWKEKKEG
jgi:hypothetical protein